MSSTVKDPIEYLQSANRYKDLRIKARKCFFENQAKPDQRDLIQKIIAISPTDPNFQQMVEQNLFPEIERVRAIISNLMEIVQVVDDSHLENKETVALVPKAPAVARVAARSLNLHTRPPSKNESDSLPEAPATPKRNSVRASAAEEAPFTITPADFETVMEQIKQLNEPGNEFVKQFRAVKTLMDMDPGLGFEDAVSRCLGPTALKIAIKKDPGVSRTALLREFVETLLKRAGGQAKVQRTFSSRSGSVFARPNRALPAAARAHSFNLPNQNKQGMKQKRSSSAQQCEAALTAYPPALQTPADMQFTAVSAVMIRILCGDKCADLFKKRKEKEIVDRFLDFFLYAMFCDAPYERCVERFFGLLNSQEGPLLIKVFEELNKTQTISRIQQGIPQIPHHYELPAVLTRAPFNDKEETNRFIRMLAKTKFEWAETLYSEYTEGERRIVELLLKAAMIMHTMHFDYATCLKILVSRGGHFEAEDVVSLYNKEMKRFASNANSEQEEVFVEEEAVIPLAASASESFFSPEIALEKIRRNCWITQPFLFRLFMENVGSVSQITRDFKTKELCKMFDVISRRVDQESITLEQAKVSSLTMNGLRTVLHSDHDAANIGELQNFIVAIAPKLYVSHSSLDSKDAFLTLIRLGGEFPFSPSLEKGLLATLERLELAGKLLSDSTMSYAEAILFLFNDSALRAAFGSNLDRENAENLQEYIDQILANDEETDNV